MADTPRQRTTLEEIFANNNSQSITAQDIRDLLASTPLMTEPTEYGTAATHDESYFATAISPHFAGTPTGLGIPTYSVLSENANTTNNTMTDSGLSLPVVIGTYEFFAFLSCSSNNYAGSSYGINGIGTLEGSVLGNTDSSFLSNVRINAFDASTDVWMANMSDGLVIFQGIATITETSTIKIQYMAIGEPPEGTSTINTNSFLKVTKIA